MGAHYQFAHTAKQHELMELILKAADSGAFITVKELHAKVSYGKDCKKQAILCSLRLLEKHGFIAKKYRGPKSAEIVPTAQAYTVFRANPVI